MVDIKTVTPETTIDVADKLPFGDVSGDTWAAITVANFFQSGVGVVRAATNLKVNGGTAGTAGSLTIDTGNGSGLSIKTLSEETTIAAAASTDTVIQMPAGAIILAVSVYVTVVIPTAATFTVGDAGSVARFSTAAVAVAATSSDRGTKAGAYYNASAAAVRLTPNAQPGAATGKVRVVITYLEAAVPTA